MYTNTQDVVSGARYNGIAYVDEVMRIFNEALDRHGTRIEGSKLTIRFREDELQKVVSFLC